MDFLRHDSGVRWFLKRAVLAAGSDETAVRHRRALDLAIPRWVASPQSPTPFHQTTVSIPIAYFKESKYTAARFPVMDVVVKHHPSRESHSRATENYPQSRRETQVVRLPGGTLGQRRYQDRDRNSDRFASQQPAGLLGLRPDCTGLRPSGPATVRVCAVMANRGLV